MGNYLRRHHACNRDCVGQLPIRRLGDQMSILSLVPRIAARSLVLRFPVTDLDLVAFRDLTPIGVETILAVPIAPSIRQFLEIVTTSGAVVLAEVRAVHCRPIPVMPDGWTFAVTWEFISDDDFEGRICALLDASALETANEVWH